MLSRFASSVDVGGSSRDERRSKYGMLRTAFSTSAIGLTAFTAYHQYMHNSKYWRAFPAKVRELLGRPFPWEAQAEYAAAQMVPQHVMRTPQSVLDLTAKYDSPTTITTKQAISESMIKEISDLEDYLDINDTRRVYLSQAKLDTFMSKDLVSGGSVADVVSSYPEEARKYRKNLRKYKAIFERNDPKVRATVSSMLADADDRGIRSMFINAEHKSLISQQKIHQVPVEYDFGGITYKPVQVPDSWGWKAPGKFSMQKFLTDAQEGGMLSWKNRDLYQSIPEYKALNIARVGPAMDRIIKRLNSSLSRKAQDYMQPGSTTPLSNLYSVRPELITFGNGDMGIRIVMRLQRESRDNAITNLDGTTTVQRLGTLIDDLIIPLNNNGTFQLSRGGGRLVAGIRAESGSRYRGGPFKPGQKEYLSPEMQIARAIEDKADDIIEDLAGGRSIKAKGEIQAMMATRATQAKGGLADLGVRLTVEEEDLMMIHPAYQIPEDQRRGMADELGKLRSRHYALRYQSGMSEERSNILSRIELLKAQLGIGYDVSERIMELNRRMGRMIDPAGDPIRFFWEKSASHAGAYRMASVYGMGPLTFQANPQASVYQLWNTYPMAPDIRSAITLRWGTGKDHTKYDSLIARFAEPNFMTARVGLMGDIYPYNQSGASISRKFKERMDMARDRAARTIATGDEAMIRIGWVDGKASIEKKQVELNNLISEWRGTVQHSQLDADKGYVLASLRNVQLRPNTVVGYNPSGDPVRVSMSGGRVIGLDIDKGTGELVIRIDKFNTSAARVASAVTRIKTMPTVQEGMKVFTTNALGLNLPLDMITRAQIYDRVSYNIIETAMVEDAIKHVKAHRKIMLTIMNNIGNKFSDKAKVDAGRAYDADVARLKGVARVLGVTYDEAIDMIPLPRAWSRKAEHIEMQKITPAQVDKILILCGKVYKDDDEYREVLNHWDQYGMKFARHLKAPPDVVERMTPRPGGPQRLVMGGTGAQRGLMVTLTDWVGYSRQNYADLAKTFGLKTGVNAGIPFRYTDLGILMDRFMRVPGEAGKALNTAMERYVGYLAGQMGGGESSDELRRLLEMTIQKDIPEGEIIRMGTPEYGLFSKALADTKLPGMPDAEQMWIIDGELIYGADANEKLAIARSEGRIPRKIQGYKVKTANLGILGNRRWSGKYIETPYDIEYSFAGATNKSNLVPLLDPSKMKIQPVQVGGAGGPYTIVPAHYYNVVRALDAARTYGDITSDEMISQIEYNVGAGTGVPTGRAVPRGGPGAGSLGIASDITRKNMGLAMESAMDELFIGKHSYLRMYNMMARESGLHGIVAGIPTTLTHEGRTFKFLKRAGGEYGPADIIVSGKFLDANMKEVIMNNLVEKYSDTLKDDEAMMAARDEFARIAKGRQPFPVMAIRHPLLSKYASGPGWLYFDNRLNKMGDASYQIFMGELFQRAMLGDLDADLAAIMIAKHWGGSAEVVDMLSTGVEYGDTRIYEGSPRFQYATGMEVYGDGQALGDNDFTAKLMGVKGRPEGLRVPRVYRLKSIDKGVGYHIEVMGVSRDVKGTNYLSKWRTVDSQGKPYIFMPGEWTNFINAAVKDGSPPDPNTLEALNLISADERAKILNAPQFRASIGAIMQHKADLYTGLMAQKGYVGHATSYAMALNLLGAQHLTRAEQEIYRTSLAQGIQWALQAKKWSGGEISKEAAKYGQYTTAMKNVVTLDDHFARTLMAPEEEGGLGIWTESAVRAHLKIPVLKRSKIFPDAGISYELLYKAQNHRDVGTVISDLVKLWGAGEADGTTMDLVKSTRLEEYLTKAYEQINAANTQQSTPSPGGYFTRKPFIGPLGRNRINDTELADSIGADSATVVKAGLVGAGILGGLYLAANFFKPNQMDMLGDMPGTGGEFWGPMRGSRMELPWRIPIGVPEYTWNAPPYDRKKARVELFNPISAENMAMAPGRLMDALSPITNWGIAPQGYTQYNNRSRNNTYTIDNAIKSSRIILR